MSLIKPSSIRMFILTMLVFCTGCGQQGAATKGNGKITTKTVPITGIMAIDALGVGDITIRFGSREVLTITTDENILAGNIQTVVTGDTLHLTHSGSIRPTRGVQYELVLTSLDMINLGGSIHARVNDIDAQDLEIIMSGASELEIFGQARILALDCSGSSQANAMNLLSDTVQVSLSGASEASVHALTSLDANVSGASMLFYDGTTSSASFKTTGAAEIKNIQESR
ncbi:MAG: hypothetical protein CMJ32_07280 [Phycisphaerae bacterium]|nr:hypothetical protein [Phycisphaerae bacterium]